MPAAPLPACEPQRLAALRSYGVLDTPREAVYDELTQLAAYIAQAPTALVSLVDQHRQWFKSTHGLDACETHRDAAFCSYTILNDASLIVQDATQDPRFADNPLVTGDMHLRAYAGFPLIVPGGHRLGTLCILDTTPRGFTAVQLEQLTRIAHQVTAQLVAHLRVEELRAERQRLEKISSQVPGVVYQYLLRPDGTSCFPYASEGIRAIYEVSPQEVATDAQPVIQRLHPHDAPSVLASITESASQLTPWRAEFRYRTDEGGYRWLQGRAMPQRDAHGNTLWHGFITDISAERHTQERLRLALSGARLGMWDWNILTHEVYFSDAWYRLLGYKPDAFVPSFENWKKLVHPDDFKQVHPALERHFADPACIYDLNLRHRAADGSWRWVNAVGEVVERDEHGKPSRMIGIHRDTHEEHLILEQLKHARANAESANAAKSAFLANMSHEIRTPMTAILGYADLLTDPRIEPSEQQNYASTIKRNGEHLLTVINDILDFSRIESGRIELEHQPVDLAELLRDVTDLMRIRAEGKGLWMGLRVPAHRVVVQTDPTRLRQVLMNLVGNAVKFTEAGSVTIELQAELAADAQASSARFIITDTGIGIPADKLPTLFQPFTQTDCSHTRRFGGTGLGLSICQRLTGLLGGAIEVASVSGEGSTFVVRFDRLALATGPAHVVGSTHRPRITPEQDALRGRRILLAEDGPDNRRLIGMHLRRAGAELTTVDNGEDAVTAARAAVAAGEPFDVILMDVQMPRMDGHEATRQLRATGYPHHILTLTAHAMQADHDLALANGSDGFLSKPIDVAELIAACCATDHSRSAAA